MEINFDSLPNKISEIAEELASGCSCKNGHRCSNCDQLSCLLDRLKKIESRYRVLVKRSCLKQIPDGPDDVIQCQVLLSASIFEATKEASVMASDRQKTVTFDFNDIAVSVRPGDDPIAVANAWWFEAYGETQEESFAKR